MFLFSLTLAPPRSINMWATHTRKETVPKMVCPEVSMNATSDICMTRVQWFQWNRPPHDNTLVLLYLVCKSNNCKRIFSFLLSSIGWCNICSPLCRTSSIWALSSSIWMFRKKKFTQKKNAYRVTYHQFPRRKTNLQNIIQDMFI